MNFQNIDRLTANDKDFSLALEMTIREVGSLTSDSLTSPSLQSLVTSHFSPSAGSLTPFAAKAAALSMHVPHVPQGFSPPS